MSEQLIEDVQEDKREAKPKRFLKGIREFIHKQRPYLVLLLFVTIFIGIVYFNKIFITIDPGERGVLWRRFGGGTVVNRIYCEGLHIIWPFNKMYVYNIRRQRLSDTIKVLSLNGLTIELEYSVLYCPTISLLPMLHQKVGPDYAQKIVFPEVRSVVRSVIGQNRPEDIYTNQKRIQSRISDLSKAKLESRFITLDYVPVERISLPRKISNAIENKLAQQQLQQEYKYRLAVAKKEAERKKIEANGLKNYNTVLSKSVDKKILQWQGIMATKELAKSNNSKVVVIGAGDEGLPLILGK